MPRAPPDSKSLICFGIIGPRNKTSQRPGVPYERPEQDRKRRRRHGKLGMGLGWAQDLLVAQLQGAPFADWPVRMQLFCVRRPEVAWVGVFP